MSLTTGQMMDENGISVYTTKDNNMSEETTVEDDIKTMASAIVVQQDTRKKLQDCGTGYRLLKEGEVIQNGDQVSYWNAGRHGHEMDAFVPVYGPEHENTRGSFFYVGGTLARGRQKMDEWRQVHYGNGGGKDYYTSDAINNCRVRRLLAVEKKPERKQVKAKSKDNFIIIEGEAVHDVNTNRESWLLAAACLMAVPCAPSGMSKFSVGYGPGGTRGSAGYNIVTDSSNKKQVFISPAICDKVVALKTMEHALHELGWNVLGLADALPEYPQTGVQRTHKTQTTRLIKVECGSGSGYTVRVTRKWINRGMPHCPCHVRPMVEIPDASTMILPAPSGHTP